MPLGRAGNVERSPDLEVRAEVICPVQLLRMVEGAAFLVAYERVVLETVPELPDDLDVLLRAGIAEGVRVLLIEIEIVRGSLGCRRHDVPAGPAAGDEVERGEFAGEVVGLLVGGGGRRNEAEMGGERRECGKQRHRLETRHLSASTFRGPTERDRQAVGEEIGVEETPLGGKRELLVKLEVRGAIGRLVGVPPGGDMLSAAGKKGAKLDLSCHGRVSGLGFQELVARASAGLRQRPIRVAIGRSLSFLRYGSNWPTARSRRAVREGEMISPPAKSRSEA